MRTPENIAAVAETVCVKSHQHQFTDVLNNFTFRRHQGDKFYIKTLVWRHTNFNWFTSWSQLTIQCVFVYFENHGNVAEFVRRLRTDFVREEKHRQLRMFVILLKKWKKLATSSINQCAESQKQWQKVCVKRHQHQFSVVLNIWTFRRHHWDEFCIKVQELKSIDQTMRFRFAKWASDNLQKKMPI